MKPGRTSRRNTGHPGAKDRMHLSRSRRNFLRESCCCGVVFRHRRKSYCALTLFLFEWRILCLETTRGKRSTFVVVFCPLRYSRWLDDGRNGGCCLPTALSLSESHGGRSYYSWSSPRMLTDRCWADAAERSCLMQGILLWSFLTLDMLRPAQQQ